MPLNIQAIRAQFPALSANAVEGVMPVYFDNPAGTQVPQSVIDAIADYYTHRNANTGGTFATSKRNDEMQTAVRQKLAAFLNAPSPKEIVLGPNMTTLTFALSRAIARTLKPGDEIVLTRMDHDANVNPWLLMAQDNGLVVRWIDVDTTDCTLDMDSFEAALTDRTKLVAIVHASNAVGTINPVNHLVQMAKAAGALVFIDAVQSAPHIPIDVQDLGCDFLACSSYKFFGPHMGILWGKYDLLAELPAYKVRPAKDVPPYRWETGTPNYECFAAIGAVMDYIAAIGRDYGADYAEQFAAYDGVGRDLKCGMAAIAESERDLVQHLIEMLQGIDGLTIYGITDSERLTERVPTVVFALDGYVSQQVAAFLAEKQIQVWHGDYYAVEIMAKLGYSDDGLLRVGLAHYNTKEEIDRLEAALKELVGK